jgi:alpha-tubulin suppressor-like RCC1 family protein
MWRRPARVGGTKVVRLAWIAPLILTLAVSACGGGQASPSSAAPRNTPPSVVSHPAGRALAPLAGATDVAAGEQSTCALVAGGTVQCWGYNEFGQLGNGTTIGSLTPVRVSGLSGVTTIALGGDHACAIVAGGEVECWGSNFHGQLGTRQTADGPGSDSNTPVLVEGVSGAIEIAAGLYHTCALISDGAVKCWGDDVHGQLGDGGTSSVLMHAPVSVIGLSDVTHIAAGSIHTCAVVSSGQVRCWGGDESTLASSDDHPIPTAIAGVTGASAIDAGDSLDCAIVAGGAVTCWAFGSGSGNIVAAAIVTGLPKASAIQVGGDYACALAADGIVRCWGGNHHGQLGDGGTEDGLLPVRVVSLNGAVAVSAGFSHACAVTSGGAVRCWGDNESGQLGDGTTTSSPKPTIVVAGSSDGHG